MDPNYLQNNGQSDIHQNFAGNASFNPKPYSFKTQKYIDNIFSKKLQTYFQ